MIDLEVAYRIRAEAVAFIANYTGPVLTTDIVAAEMRRLHPELSAEDALHLAERVDAFLGMTGLDYYEAPERPDGLREWYPVRRDGRLQRVPVGEITGVEFSEIVAEEKRQFAELEAQIAETREEMDLLADAGMRDDPNMTVSAALNVLEAREATLSAPEIACLHRLRTKAGRSPS